MAQMEIKRERNLVKLKIVQKRTKKAGLWVLATRKTIEVEGFVFSHHSTSRHVGRGDVSPECRCVSES